MDKSTQRGLVAFSLVLAVPVALAQQPAARPPVAAEMDQLKLFLGKWKCEGKAFANPLSGPEHTFKATAESKLESGGHWQVFLYEEKKSKEHEGVKVHGLWGWDAGNKRFVRSAGDDSGVWDSATAPGFQGDRLMWTGELSGPNGKLPFHHTFTKKSEKEWSHSLEVKGPNGKWAPWEEVICKR